LATQNVFIGPMARGKAISSKPSAFCQPQPMARLPVKRYYGVDDKLKTSPIVTWSIAGFISERGGNLHSFAGKLFMVAPFGVALFFYGSAVVKNRDLLYL